MQNILLGTAVERRLYGVNGENYRRELVNQFAQRYSLQGKVMEGGENERSQLMA
jgi:hypothetical protein